jgi:hypothetical protein
MSVMQTPLRAAQMLVVHFVIATKAVVHQARLRAVLQEHVRGPGQVAAAAILRLGFSRASPAGLIRLRP